MDFRSNFMRNIQKLWIISIIALTGFVVISCDNNNGTSACTHNWEWEVTTPATCTVEGIETKTCTLCGEEDGTEVIAALGHDIVPAENTIHPTCTEEGFGNTFCTRCDYTESDVVIPAYGHNYSAAIPATCTTASIPGNCSRCSAVEPVIPAYGHYMETNAITKPTCYENGFGNLNCIYCEYVESGVILPALGCDYIEIVVGTCMTCAELECSRCKEILLSIPGGHNMQPVENAIHPTCTEDGFGDTYCIICNEYAESNVVIPALGHDWKWAEYVSGSGLRQCQRDSSCTAKAGIGDTGPRDGIIFYANQSGFSVPSTTTVFTAYTACYLEARSWALPYKYQVRTSSTSIGYWDYIGLGRNATALLIARGNHSAAQACVNYGNDWYLPNLEELKTLYNNLVSGKIDHNFESGYYWTSSEEKVLINNIMGSHNEYRPYSINFRNGYEDYWETSAYAHPIRAF